MRKNGRGRERERERERELMRGQWRSSASNCCERVREAQREKNFHCAKNGERQSKALEISNSILISLFQTTRCYANELMRAASNIVCNIEYRESYEMPMDSNGNYNRSLQTSAQAEPPQLMSAAETGGRFKRDMIMSSREFTKFSSHSKPTAGARANRRC